MLLCLKEAWVAWVYDQFEEDKVESRLRKAKESDVLSGLVDG
jgi:hypothetical protein